MATQTLLKEQPARNPAQSLDEKINKIEGESVNDAVLLFVLPIIFCIVVWIIWAFNIQVNPVLVTIILLPVSAFALMRMFKIRKYLHDHRLGREGERIVGQYLNKLNYFGYRVIHDVVFERGNIDHLIVCKKGVFTIETKTLRKKGKGDGNISYDGKNVLVNGASLPRNPIPQAQGQARQLAKFIKMKTAEKIPVQPIVVFPDWFVENEVTKDIWLISHKQIRYKIMELEDKLSQKEVDIICNNIYEHVTSTDYNK